MKPFGRTKPDKPEVAIPVSRTAAIVARLAVIFFSPSRSLQLILVPLHAASLSLARTSDCPLTRPPAAMRSNGSAVPFSRQTPQGSQHRQRRMHYTDPVQRSSPAQKDNDDQFAAISQKAPERCFLGTDKRPRNSSQNERFSVRIQPGPTARAAATAVSDISLLFGHSSFAYSWQVRSIRRGSLKSSRRQRTPVESLSMIWPSHLNF